jgi:hypothetical protein
MVAFLLHARSKYAVVAIWPYLQYEPASRAGTLLAHSASKQRSCNALMGVQHCHTGDKAVTLQNLQGQAGLLHMNMILAAMQQAGPEDLQIAGTAACTRCDCARQY